MTLAWNAYARSIEYVLGAATATFSIHPLSQGVAVGFSGPGAPTSGLSHMRFAVVCQLGFLYHHASGTLLGRVGVDDVIRIDVTGAAARFSVNDVLLHTQEGATAPAEQLYLASAFQAQDDLVHTPVLLQGTYGGGGMRAGMAPLAARMGAAESGVMIARMAPLTGAMDGWAPGGSMQAMMTPLAGYFSRSMGGSLDAHMAPLTASGYGDNIPRLGSMRAIMAPLTGGLLLRVGGLGQMSAQMAPMQGYISETSAGKMAATMAPLRAALMGRMTDWADFITVTGFGVDFDIQAVATADFLAGISFGVGFEVGAASAVDFDTRISFGVEFEAEVGSLVDFDTRISFGVEFEAEVGSLVDFDTRISFGISFGVESVPLLQFDTAIHFDVGYEATPVAVAFFETGVSFGAEWQVSAIANVDFGVGVRFGVRFYAMADSDDGAEVWVLNVKSGGSTRYRNYPFNSFARIGDAFYGAGQGGLYLLDGPDDAGAEIAAVIDLGRLDFGGSQKKTVAQCYVGMAGQAPLLLSVDAEGATFVYPTRSYSEHLQQQRVTLGKGLKTNYVNLQLMNQDGADFEVDGMELVVADLSRRI